MIRGIKRTAMLGFLKYDAAARGLTRSIPTPSTCATPPSTAAGNDLWEEVLNNAMMHRLGWGTEADLDRIVRRGMLSANGLFGFVEHFVHNSGVLWEVTSTGS
ncbi:hypothetical protein DFP72DRAFT_1053525 [Ephemerocybe angulata]|uniref:Uncharacterized protein n=1 Tax=Ephemerocybe angulata TaxID=980116 RepID=A0A8H6HAR4_9AGAR|nr:hypothetical protein DFP72DRAFT_1055747 [Tulosesus angulatus]KAF6742122.1 hypothetical protein DFP72DRAFT_861070 [Tulosesus angulatus]KAF6743020.1 hypothetical protein DFP72DRAFT_1053525 [Tulosesus angulatus]